MAEFSPSMHDTPIAVDLFCGGGGFSEGLEQAGFEITHAIDIEERACDTYRLNHPDTEVIEADLLEFEPEELPQNIDLLFGSPPCTEFSWAKSGGGGDIEEGMKLVKRFLYFVVELEPDYWIMENVPRLDNYLPTEIDLNDIPWTDNKGVLEIEKHILSSNDYGAPQRRDRLFSGVFPVPEPTGKPAPSFGDVRENFPRPVNGPTPGESVSDLIYKIELDETNLTDHFYNSHLTHREAKEIRVRKEDHSFYGKMSFPDDPNVPSRTVLATNRRVARETLVMEESTAPEGLSRFRKPTIREIAAIQGFPITYQFTGNSQAQKWRRVGDAVAVPVAFEIGRSLRDDMELEVPDSPSIATECPDIDTNLNERDTSWKGRRSLSISRKFRHHIPHDNKQAFRVDIETDKDNGPLSPLSQLVEEEEIRHPVKYNVILYKGYSTEVESIQVNLENSERFLVELLDQYPKLNSEITNIVGGFVGNLGPMTPDATTLQAIRSRRHDRDEPLDYELLETISNYDGNGIIDEYLPRDQYIGEATIQFPNLLDGGTELPARVVMKLFGATYLCEKLNYCAKWMNANPEDVFVPEELEDDIKITGLRCQQESGEPCIDTRLQEIIDSEIGEANLKEILAN